MKPSPVQYRNAGKVLALLLGSVVVACAQSDQAIYTDSLQNGWQDWGWATIDYNHGTTVHSGSTSISVSATDWEALYMGRGAALDASPFTLLSFWIHGGPSGGQALQVQSVLSGTAQPHVALPPLTGGAWQEVTLSLADLGVSGAPNLTGFWIQSASAATQPTFYVDTVKLLAGPQGTGTVVEITVNLREDRHPINPMIYGVNWASAAQLTELNAPVNRAGGNATTRHNWHLNASNRAHDWYFQSISDGPATPGAEGDAHVQSSRNGAAEPMLTIPMIGWMPKLGPGRSKLASYSISKYGPQTDNDWQWMPDAGNGVSVTGNTPITWNDPNDANFQTNSNFQQAWIAHLTHMWGTASEGGVRYYCMDNEHTLWHSTHRDVHPVGTTMREIRDAWIDYGSKIKAVDPDALLFGPEEWGWRGWLYSGYDSQWARQNGWPAVDSYPDRSANGGMDYGPWLLDQFRQHEENTGRRLLDVFTLHLYPQNGEFSDDVSESMQRQRNRGTRVLWDTHYVDTSWINDIIMMIPRMHAWVDTYYPGTPIGITEYNWGAEDHINGATAQADIYGIFGREGLDYGTRWTTPSIGSPVFNAMKMYRNYDGANSTFGNVNVSTQGNNDPDEVSCFAAERTADGALAVMAINKQLSDAVPVSITLSNFYHGGMAEAWRLDAGNAIARVSDVLVNAALETTLPAQSITLFVIPPGPQPRLEDPAIQDGTNLTFLLEAQIGEQFEIQRAFGLSGWAPVSTSVTISASQPVTVPATARETAFRARWLP